MALRDLGPQWATLLSQAGSDVHVRPEPNVWSAIEYAAHSRDITALHVFGVEQALTGDEPSYPAIDGDQLIDTAATTYLDAQIEQVVPELTYQACRLADLAEEAGVGAWTRGLTIGESRSDARRLLEHALHDSRHHLVDVKNGLSIIKARGA
jgi:hypothetical protein